VAFLCGKLAGTTDVTHGLTVRAIRWGSRHEFEDGSEHQASAMLPGQAVPVL